MITMQSLTRMVNSITAPLKRRVQLMIGRCVITTVKSDSGIQTAQYTGLAGEVKDDDLLMQHYGFTSVPPINSAGIAVYPGGNREDGVIIATENRTLRLKDLGQGEVALYDASSKIHLKNTGDIDIESIGEINVTGSTVKIGDGLVQEAPLKGETFQTTHNTHIHTGNLGFVTTPVVTPSAPTDLHTSVELGS